jgi:hypothetical protein
MHVKVQNEDIECYNFVLSSRLDDSQATRLRAVKVSKDYFKDLLWQKERLPWVQKILPS